MIEIIKEGKKIPKNYLDKKRKAKCTVCGCKFTFTYRDIDTYMIPSIDCPRCQHTLLVHNVNNFRIITAKRLQQGE